MPLHCRTGPLNGIEGVCVPGRPFWGLSARLPQPPTPHKPRTNPPPLPSIVYAPSGPTLPTPTTTQGEPPQLLALYERKGPAPVLRARMRAQRARRLFSPSRRIHLTQQGSLPYLFWTTYTHAEKRGDMYPATKREIREAVQEQKDRIREDSLEENGMTRSDLDEQFSPDTIAECYNVPRALRARLWNLVPIDQPTPGEDDVPEGYRFKPYAWAHLLSEDEFTTIIDAITKEDY